MNVNRGLAMFCESKSAGQNKDMIGKVKEAVLLNTCICSSKMKNFFKIMFFQFGLYDSNFNLRPKGGGYFNVKVK